MPTAHSKATWSKGIGHGVREVQGDCKYDQSLEVESGEEFTRQVASRKLHCIILVGLKSEEDYQKLGGKRTLWHHRDVNLWRQACVRACHYRFPSIVG